MAQRSDPRRWREFRAAHSPRGLTASALRQAASATATSEHGLACMHAAMARCPRDLIHSVLESRSLEHHVHWDFPFLFLPTAPPTMSYRTE